MSTLEAWPVEPGAWRWRWAGSIPCALGPITSTYCEIPGAIVVVDPVVPPDGTPDHARLVGALDADLARTSSRIAVLATRPEHAGGVARLAARWRGRACEGLPSGVRLVRLADEEAVLVEALSLLIVGHAGGMPGVRHVLRAHDDSRDETSGR